MFLNLPVEYSTENNSARYGVRKLDREKMAETVMTDESKIF